MTVRSIRSAAAPLPPPPFWQVPPKQATYPRTITPSSPGLYQPTPPGQKQTPYGVASPSVADSRFDIRTLPDQVAPWVQIDRYPIIAGANLTLDRLSSVFRMALTGYRQLYVDMLDELIEKDPHAYGVVSKRALAVANAKIHVEPALLAANAPEAQKTKAAEIAEFVHRSIDNIPNLRQHLASLAWGFYYALQGAEIIWGLDSQRRWVPEDLVMIHSRRLSYPDPWRWDLYVWDQGAVIGAPYGQIQLPPGIFGWKVEDYPGKFIIHAPQVRGDYPVREGVGRQVAYWIAIKHIAARAAPIYLERFAKPWLDIRYKTGDKDGEHRKATPKDIADAQRFAQVGSFNGAAHSDAVELEVKSADGTGRPKITFKDWFEICNAEISKAVLGGTLGTEVSSSGGNRALGNTQRKDTLAFYQYDAAGLAAAIDSGLVKWLVRLNYPGEDDLCPHVRLLVEDDPDPDELAKRAVALSSQGYPVDADALEALVGIPIADPNDKTARVMRPVQLTPPDAHPVAPAYFSNPTKTPEEYEAEKQDALDRQDMLHAQQIEEAEATADDSDEEAAVANERADKAAKTPPPKPPRKSPKRKS